MMPRSIEDELAARESEWRSTMFELTEYYVEALAVRDASINELGVKYAEASAESSRLAAVVSQKEASQAYNEALLARIRNSVWWKIARVFVRRR